MDINPIKKKDVTSSFVVPPAKRIGFFRSIKDKFFSKKISEEKIEEIRAIESENYVQQMLKILSTAQYYGIMTEEQKDRMAALIFKNGGFPREYRSQLWTLASGSEMQRRNNKGYYIVKENEDMERKMNEYPELTEHQNNSFSDEGKYPKIINNHIYE